MMINAPELAAIPWLLLGVYSFPSLTFSTTTTSGLSGVGEGASILIESSSRRLTEQEALLFSTTRNLFLRKGIVAG